MLFLQGSFGKTRPHQRQGIGKKLLEEALATFPNVYQRLLATERSEKKSLYQSYGLSNFQSKHVQGMIYRNKESGTEIAIR